MRPLERRPRRLRRTAPLRELVSETIVPVSCLVQPHFVVPGQGVKEEIEAMPGVFHESVDVLVESVRHEAELGIKAVLLFGVPDEESKSPDGRAAYAEGNLVAQAVGKLKESLGDQMVVMTDVCLCAYTTHGHCGIVRDGRIDNDATLPKLARMALSHARAGADVVAPSDMMDGRVAAIREVLDEEGFQEVAIMSYSAKYASSYYGPFREAAHSAPEFGDRRSYQMDPRNAREALIEVFEDIEEGADIVMVKPGLAYLDVVRLVRESVSVPVAVYNVSGEYSMVKAAATRGWIDEKAVVVENLHAFRRAGADVIITYHAREAVERGWLG